MVCTQEFLSQPDVQLGNCLNTYSISIEILASRGLADGMRAAHLHGSCHLRRTFACSEGLGFCTSLTMDQAPDTAGYAKPNQARRGSTYRQKETHLIRLPASAPPAAAAQPTYAARTAAPRAAAAPNTVRAAENARYARMLSGQIAVWLAKRSSTTSRGADRNAGELSMPAEE